MKAALDKIMATRVSVKLYDDKGQPIGEAILPLGWTEKELPKIVILNPPDAEIRLFKQNTGTTYLEVDSFQSVQRLKDEPPPRKV